MRQIVCPICGGTERKTVYPATLPADFDEKSPPSPYACHYQINECAGCGLIHSNPIMDEPGVAALYRESSETNVTPGEEPNVRRTMELYYRLAAPHLPARRKMLDIGCDMGFLLEAARADGFTEMHGLEPNPIARATAANIPGSMVAGNFYEQADYSTASFDLIAMIHVLDHLADPRIVLSRARDHLRPGGVLLAVVHNVDSILGRLLRERFPVFNLYHHFFFSKATLAELFRRHGYEVIDVVSTRNCYSVGFFVNRLPGVPEWFKRLLLRSLDVVGLAMVPLTISVGNIGIVARRSNG